MNTKWYIRTKGVFVFFFSLLHQLRHSFIISRKTSASHRTCAKKAANDVAQAKSNSIIAKRPAKRKSRAEEQYQVSILPPWKIAHAYPSWNYTFNIWLQKWKFRCFFAIYSQPVFTTAPVYIDWLLSQINLLFSKVEEYFPVISSFFA